MSARGRPFRFLALVSAGWVCARAAMIWPVGAPTFVPKLVAQPGMSPAANAVDVPGSVGVFPSNSFAAVPSTAGLRTASYFRMIPDDRTADSTALALLAMVRFGQPVGQPAVGGIVSADTAVPFVGPATRPSSFVNPAETASRWSGSAWVFVRDAGVQIGGFSGGQIGGSQAGVRIGYAIDDRRRLAVFGRFTAPLQGPGRDVAFGVDWRPTSLPVRVIAEQRVSVDGQHGGPTVGAVGGVGPVALPLNFRLEGYGQAGVIVRDGGIGFADGAARIQRRIAHAGAATVSVGAGAWGAIQPDAARLDLGPTLSVDVPVKSQSLRLSVDWRQRVAGAARPASGPALTLGIDF